ncbi:TolC family protein [Caldithrix abyssi]
MKRNYLSYVILFLFFAGIHLGQAQTLTLDEAIDRALKNNELIKRQEERLLQKKHANLEALGNFLPQVKVEAGYTHLNKPLEIDLNFLREGLLQLQTGDQVKMANLQSLILNGRPLTDAELSRVQQQAYLALDAALPPFALAFKDQDYKSATLLGVQPLFLGGKLIAAKKFASSELQASKQELYKTRNDVIQQVVKNYLAVVLLNEVVKTRQNVLQAMLRHQTQAQKLFAQGLISKSDVLRARVAVAEARRNLFDDQNKLELAEIALRHILALDDQTPIVINDSLVYKALNDSLETFLRLAREGQPVLKLLSFKEQSAAQKFAAERAEFLPQVAAFGKYEMYPEYLSILEPRWAVGLRLQINLFNGFKDYNKLQEARHLKKEVHLLKTHTQRQIDLWVQKTYRQMRNAETRYLQLASDIALARENLRSQQKRFEAGLGTSLDVIDANLILEKEQIARHQSLFDYYQSMVELFAAAGNPAKIKEIWK